MRKTFFFTALLLAAMLLVIPLRTAGAEENPPGTLSGVVEAIVVETDGTTDLTTVLVTVTTGNGKSVTVRLSAETATALGLVKLETQEEQIVTVNEIKVGETIQLDPLTIILAEGATPLPVDVFIEGIVQSIEVEVDVSTQETAVLVSLMDGEGVTTVYRLSNETAVGLELVTVEIVPVEVLVSDETMIGQPLLVAPEDILAEIKAANPVGEILGTFFGNLFGVDPGLVGAYHEEGMGYGVIAQAGIMSYAMGSDGTMMESILDAKLSGDYSTIILPDGSTPENWGQLRQSVMKQENAIKNLGSIVSGRADEVLNDTGAVDEEMLAGDTVDTNNDPGRSGNSNGHGGPDDHGKPDDKKNNGHGQD